MSAPKEAVSIRSSISKLQPSVTLMINERSKDLLAAGKRVYRLGFGQSPFPIPAPVVQSLRDNAGEKDYLPVRGLPALRQAIAQFNQRKLGINSRAEDIMIGPGSKELLLGLHLASKADLLLPSPSWVSYRPQAQMVRKNVIHLQTEEKEKWLLTAEKLDSACRQQKLGNKILLLNYPSNPVGTTYQETQLRELAEVARQHQLLVIADEIYSELTFAGNHYSLAAFYPEGTIVSSGLSKWCGAGGWRLGTFSFPSEYRYLLDAMAIIASESFSAVSAPVQYAAITAFEGSALIEDYLKRSHKILHACGHYVYDSLSKAGLRMPKPEGGFYLFPNFELFRSRLEQKGIFTSRELCERLLEETGVALLPGTAFGRPKKEYSCRLSYVDFNGEKALKAVRDVEEGTLGIDFIKKYCPHIFEATKVIEDWLKQ